MLLITISGLSKQLWKLGIYLINDVEGDRYVYRNRATNG